MSRDLILHIGTTKTGSTSIQNVLARSRPELAAQGVMYPRSPGDAQHDLLAYALMENLAQRERLDTALWRGLTPDVRIAQFREELADEIRSAPPGIKRFIISTEFIYILLRKPTEVQAVHDLLRPLFDHIKVVVYLRRQDSHFTSLYTQLLRSGEVVAPDQLKMRARPLHELDYAKMLDRWVTVFGHDAIEPRLFDPPPGGRFDAVQDFLDLCGVVLPNAADVPESNSSMAIAGQHLLIDLGRMIQARDKVRIVAGPVWKSLTDAVTAAVPGRGWRPVRAAAEKFYAQFKESNETVRAGWFPERATLFTEDFSDYPEAAAEVDREAMYEAACATMLTLAQREQERSIRQAHDAVRQARSGGNPGRIKAALQRCIRIDPGHVGVRLLLAELHLTEGHMERARSALTAVSAFAPDDPGVVKFAARISSGDLGRSSSGAQSGMSKAVGSGSRGKGAGVRQRPAG